MPWGRLDDTLHSNGKVWSFSDKAFRVWIYSVSYCNQKRLKDPHGLLSEAEARQMCQLAHAGRAIIAELVEKVGWEQRSDGYRIHDFEDYGPKIDMTAAERQRRRRGKGTSHGDVTRDGHGDVTAPVPVPQPVPHGAASPSEHHPERQIPLVVPASAAPPQPPGEVRPVPKPSHRPKVSSEHQALVDALVAEFHADSPPNTNEIGRITRAAKLLRESRVDVPGLQQLIATARERWEGEVDITPLGIASNVRTLRTARPATAPTRNGRRPIPDAIEEAKAKLLARRSDRGAQQQGRALA